MYPECPICPKEEPTVSCLDTIIIQKKQIFLRLEYLSARTEQKCKRKDSTKGFIRYSMKFIEDFS